MTSKNGQRTGMSAAIRNYLREHPGSTGAVVAEAIGLDRDEVCKALARQARLGIFTKECTKGGPYAYTLAREPKIRALPKAEAAARRKARQKVYGANRRAAAALVREALRPKIQASIAAKPEPAKPGALPSSFDYEAAGGHVERLPATWEQPQRYGRVGFSGRERMGSPGHS